MSRSCFLMLADLKGLSDHACCETGPLWHPAVPQDSQCCSFVFLNPSRDLERTDVTLVVAGPFSGSEALDG